MAVATAVVLHRGSMVECSDLVGALEAAVEAAGRPTEDMHAVHEAAGAVVEARLDADLTAFDGARYRLWTALAGIWSGKALELHRAARAA
ncbi:hypothetical protein Salmuc_02450 [Salipiger mucosus DSM 16094]|uniref:Uncharacterized protein n=2 Tax=Salipiger mucosus TaxID=263378 RepID=S9QR39_9RHOB|nr:hypothetical protein Salmuc_02450 [Salipiger mucosus DSM 16094]